MDTDASGFTSRREDPAKDGGIPDLSRQEARLWFYYRATRYIDCGYEVLHMGQVHLYTANDKGMAKTTELFGMIREYAKIHGIRQLGRTGGDTTRSPGLPTSRRKAGIIFWNIPTSGLKSTIQIHISNCRSAG